MNKPPKKDKPIKFLCGDTTFEGVCIQTYADRACPPNGIIIEVLIAGGFPQGSHPCQILGEDGSKSAGRSSLLSTRKDAQTVRLEALLST